MRLGSPKFSIGRFGRAGLLKSGPDTSWVLGSKIDLDFESDRYWLDGALTDFATVAALYGGTLTRDATGAYIDGTGDILDIPWTYGAAAGSLILVSEVLSGSGTHHLAELADDGRDSTIKYARENVNGYARVRTTSPTGSDNVLYGSDDLVGKGRGLIGLTWGEAPSGMWRSAIDESFSDLEVVGAWVGFDNLVLGANAAGSTPTEMKVKRLIAGDVRLADAAFDAVCTEAF